MVGIHFLVIPDKLSDTCSQDTGSANQGTVLITTRLSPLQLLGKYIPVWVTFDPSQHATAFISFPGGSLSNKMRLTSEDGIAFVLLLLPRTWIILGTGRIVDKARFDQFCGSYTT